MGARLKLFAPLFLFAVLALFLFRGLSLDPKKVLDFIARELVRRMADDPPEEGPIRNLWQARIDEWSQ